MVLGGWFVKAAKYQSSSTSVNNAGMFITCNKLPSFGDETENVNKRLSVFHTKAIAQPVMEAPRWIEKHAMDCLVWMINLINRNKKMLYQNERFYEREYDDFLPEEEKKQVAELEKVATIDIDEINIDPLPRSEPGPFHAEAGPSHEPKEDFEPEYPSWILRQRLEG